MSAILNRLLVGFLKAPILVYRYCLSPFFPPSCRFAPTCSEYALEALTKHGPIRGTLLAARRLSRCHPFKLLGGSSGFDPVPPVKNPTVIATCHCDDKSAKEVPGDQSFSATIGQKSQVKL